jgi:hypothetical protein
VEDLACHLRRKFASVISLPSRMRMLVEGFALPATQRLDCILRDGDVLVVGRSSTGKDARDAMVTPITKRRRLLEQESDSEENENVASNVEKLISSAEAVENAREVLRNHRASKDCNASANNEAVATAGVDEKVDCKSAAFKAAKVAALAEATRILAETTSNVCLQKEKAEIEVDRSDNKPPALAIDQGSTSPHDVAGTHAAETQVGQNHRIFVGGLRHDVTEAVLHRDFAECGRILELKIMKDKETGLSRGFAFIRFADEAAVEAAMKYDGDDFGGQRLKISRAEGKGKGKAKNAKPKGCKSIVVKGLAFAATQDDLLSIFRKCGKKGPQNVKILKDKSGESKGIAFVDFDDEQAVDEAMLLTETEVKGRRFFLDYALPRNR